MRFVAICLFCVATLLGLAACGGGGGGGGISPQPPAVTTIITPPEPSPSPPEPMPTVTPPPAPTATVAPPEPTPTVSPPPTPTATVAPPEPMPTVTPPPAPTATVAMPTATVSFDLGAPATLGAALAGAALAEYENSAAGNANNGLAGINAMGAYRRGYFGQGVTVGVIDTDFLTTHTELSANMVAGKRADAQGNLHDDIDSNYATDYGTFVAGIIAAAQNGEGMMGVAPRAKIMPLQFDFSGNDINDIRIELVPLFYPLLRHAADSRVHIVNNNWTAAAATTLFLGGEALATRKINLPPAFALSVYGEAAATGLAQMTGIAAAADMVWVWTAGYEGWNSETGLLTFDNFDENGLYAPVLSTPKQLIASATIAINGLTLALRDVPGMGENMLAGGYAGAPLAPGGEALAGKWLNVVALNAAGDAVAFWSNGCGASKYWCVAAPGEGIRSADSSNNNDYSTYSARGAAAAHASGALAVLKSRWQHLPMNVILAILLHSTDDLGEKGVDDVYGQGKINLSLAVAREGGFTIVTAPTPTVAPPVAPPPAPPSVTATISPPVAGIDLGTPASLGAALTGNALAEYNYSANGYFNNGLAGINAMGAYRRGYFGQGVTVGVLDSDLLTSHFELSANIVAGKRADAQGNLHDDITSNYYTDYGTFVAAIIAAAQNGDNMMGVAPRAKIMPLQYARNYDGNDDVLALLRHAANMQVPIVKTPTFASTLSPLFLAQITAIVATANMVFVWQEDDNRHFTGNAALAGKWLNVVALNRNSDIIASWSESCGASKHWCVAAPGENIRSADSANNADFASYTNGAAAAHAAGALAVLKSRWQHLPMDVILAIMLHSTDDLGDAGVDDVYGQGRINLSLAAAREGNFSLVVNPTVTVSPPPSPTATVSPPIPTPTVSLPTTFYLGSPAPLGAALTGDALDEYKYSAGGYSNSGLAGVGAMGAYRRGYFGRGVTVGVVDSGVLTTHNDLAANIVAGKRADRFGNLSDQINDADGHGTHVAGIVAAAQNGEGMMGVAPQAKIMPLQMGDPRDGYLTGDEISLFQHAANMRVPVVNNSWGNVFITDLLFEGEEHETGEIQLPPPFLLSLYHLTHILPDMNFAATTNMVFVWAAGNNGWNSETGRVCIKRNLFGCSYRSPAELIAAASVRIYGQTYALRNIAGMGENMVNVGYQGAPLLEGGDFLLGKWLNVVALDTTGNAIASFSNGCGASKHFCVAAPGRSIRSAYKDSNSDYARLSGTSMAAPHAAGALAVLKSRWQQLPMHVILAIMLHSTDDLGATGVDDVYGQGKINLSLAASREGVFNIETGQFTVSTQPPQTGNFIETRIELSPLLAGLRPQLAGMSVATRFLGRYYQNINFGGFVAAAPAAALPAKASDNAAAALLTPAAKAPLLPGLHLAMAGGKPLALHYENARAFARAELCHACAGDVWQEFSAAAAAPAPAFANSPRRGVAGIKLGNWRLYAAAGADEDGKNAAYTQTGAGWELKRKAYSFHADLYATQENNTFLGGKFAGAAAIGGGSLRGARLQAAATLPAGWRGFASAEGGVAAARFVAGSGIVGGKPARLAAYKLGASKGNLWHGGDNLRLGLQYHPRIVSGNLQTRFGVATDAVIKDERTQMEFHHQTAMQENTLSLKSARVVSAHIGYSRPLQRGGQLALALQHAMQEGKNQTALALQYQAAF